MSKPTTEVNLTGQGDIAVALEFEHVNPGIVSNEIEVAKVGDMRITLKPEVDAAKQEALETAAFIEKVTSAGEQALAVNCVATLKAYANGIEKSRKAVKQPFWDAGKAIDAIAAEATKEVLAEINRVEKALGAYQKQLDDEAAAARRAAEEAERERQRKIQAQLAEEQRLRDEAARKAREAQEAAAAAKTKADKLKAENARLQAELAQRQANDMARERQEEEAAQDFQPAAPGALTPLQPKGTQTRREYDIVVTDIEALYRAYGRRFVKMDLDLSALKYYLADPNVDPNKIPGIQATPAVKVSVRAAR